MNPISVDQLTRSSLGRLGFIGELYDVRTESFSSRSLLKSSSPSHLIQQRELGRMEFDYKFIKNLSDRFELIDVETELQVSFLLGLIRVEGSGKFFAEDIKSEKTVSCSLICKILTVSEKFFAPFDELLHHIDLTALNDPQYTHVIVEVNWGANCLLSLEAACNSDSEKSEIEGRLKAEMSILKSYLSVKGGGKLQKENSSVLNGENVKIKISADIFPDDSWPTTAEAFCEFAANLQKFIKKSNDGRGKPLNYVMIPLCGIRKLAKVESALNAIVIKIDESFLLSIIYYFEEISQIKQKYYDLIMKLKENHLYVRESEIARARKEQQTLSEKEAKLKIIISESWVDVKSGKKPLRDLVKEIEKFRGHELKLFIYEDFLASYSSIFDKLSIVKNYISKGVKYLGIGEKFDTFRTMFLSFEFIVIVFSLQSENNNPEIHRNTCHYFLSLAAQNKPYTKYVVVDLDYISSGQFSNCDLTETKCYHLKGTQILSSDLYADYLADINCNYAQPRQDLKMTYTQHKPGCRVVLEMVCPGFEKGTCPPDLLTWICPHCKSNIEYGFDDHFYCCCGKGQSDAFEYRCSSSGHGCLFISSSSVFLEKFLKQLRPLKEMNLLVLGQSGVGKSTWINSIINYLTYDSLETAKEYGVITTIPACFTMYDSKTLKKHIIEVGVKTDEEVTDAGVSATQNSHTYSFIWKGLCVRIIDSPGLGDTRGLDQDKINLNNIMDHISHFKVLHGVCILLKANDNRISAIFAYCLKELLTHLHKSIAKNIVFCFTNARNSFYSPGQTSALLEKIILTLGDDTGLVLGHHNMFCLDNESFLFLCSLSHPEISHDEYLVESFSRSWEISVKETERLFSTVKGFEPHLLKNTISLITARDRILVLTKPIAYCSKTIHMNLSVLEKKKEEISASEMEIKKLSKKLHHTEFYLEPEPLSMPITVCTSSSCVNYLTFRDLDIRDIEYKTHCHKNCSVKTVAKTTNNSKLRYCCAMNSNGKCKICNCSWENHMHLTYQQIRKERTVINENIQKFLNAEISEKKAKEKLVEELSRDIEKFKKENDIIIQTSVKFGIFLQRNAIACYNDSVEEYLEYLIKEEEQKPYKSETEKKIVENMKETLECYRAEVKVLQEIFNKEDENIEEITSQDIFEMEKNLYKLEMMGETIRKSVNISRIANEAMTRYAETPVQIKQLKPKPAKFSSKLFKKIKNFI